MRMLGIEYLLERIRYHDIILLVEWRTVRCPASTEQKEPPAYDLPQSGVDRLLLRLGPEDPLRLGSLPFTDRGLNGVAVFGCIQRGHGDRIRMSDLGAMLREAREAAGISLSAMAARTHFTKGHLSNVEKGRRTATPEVVLGYEQVLGDTVDRRGLLTGIAAGVVAPIAVGELKSTGFTAALGNKRPVDEWQQQVDDYGRDYMSVGAAELQNRLAGDLVVLQQHLETPALWSVAARLLTVHGKTVPSEDGARGATRWYKLAAVAADRSGDTAVRVWTADVLPSRWPTRAPDSPRRASLPTRPSPCRTGHPSVA
jgi:transcriptional regulator with XRE-family HTH domain